MQARLALFFATSGSLPLLTKSVFGIGEQEGKPFLPRGFASATALQAFTILCVQAKLGPEAAVVGSIASPLAGAIDEIRKPRKKESAERLKWPGDMFSLTVDKKEIFFLGVVQKVGSEKVVLDCSSLPPRSIEIWWKGEKIEGETDLQKLKAGLSRLLKKQSSAKPTDSVRSNSHVRSKTTMELATDGKAVVFDVADSEFDTPNFAAKTLLACLIERGPRRGGSPITVGFSGGLLQAMMIDAVRTSPLRRRLDPRVEIRALSLNRMFWPDWRIERSADYLACEFAKIMSTGRFVELPPISDQPEAEQAFRQSVLACDIFVVSGGARERSFISVFLEKHGIAQLPAKVVGDFIGHPIDENGECACTPQIQEMIRPFRCHPTLEDLDFIARRKQASIIFVVDAIPGEGAGQPSKAPLVRAVLQRRWVNFVVLSRELYDEVHHI